MKRPIILLSFLAMACMAWAKEYTVTIVDGTVDNPPYNTYGTLATTGDTKTFTSNAVSGLGGVTINAPVIDRAKWWSIYCLSLKPATAETDEKITITAPEGYLLSSMSISLRAYSSNFPYSVTVGDDTQTVTGASATTFTASDIDAASMDITFRCTASSVNWLAAQAFTLVLKDDPAYTSKGLEDGKVYKISSYQSGGTLYQLVNGSTIVNTTGTIVDDNSGYWVCHKSGTNHSFESAMGDGTYLGWQSLSDSPYQFEVKTDAINSGCYSLYSVANTGGGKYLYVHNGTGAWNRNSVPACTSGGSSDFLIEEVDAKVYTAEIKGSSEAKLTYSGEGFTGTATVGDGGFWVITGEVVPTDFTASEVEGYSKSEIILSDQTVSVNYTFNANELFSTSFDDAKWLRVNNVQKPDYSMWNTGSTLGTHTKNLSSEDELIAFVGTAENFKIYSRTKGGDYALTAANTDNGSGANWIAADEAESWRLDITYATAATNPGYGITLAKSTASQSLNMYQEVAGDCKFWTFGETNYGSRWTIEIISQETTVGIELEKETKYPENNYLWGTVSYTVTGATTKTYSLGEVSSPSTKKLYLTAASEISFSAEPYLGYTVSVNENTVTFTGTDENRQVLAYTPYKNHPYRIPAITKASNGNLLAVYDYRLCNNDVGYGEVDEVMRIGLDNGERWIEGERTIANGNPDGTLTGNVFGRAFGDPAIVADRESGKVLMMCVSGQAVFASANAGNRPLIARVTSDDNGETWNEPEDQTSQFWGKAGAIYQDAATEAEAKYFAYSGFFGAGKLLQSSYKAPGAKYYRVYGAMLLRGKGLGDGNYPTYVVYTDDFGDTWHLLGDIQKGTAAIANEPKVEELPDGRILLSARRASGRCLNIFTFTDKEKGEGTWGTAGNLYINSDSGTNGEVLIVNAVKASDESPAIVLLQSAPKGSGRNNVTVYYKDITNPSDRDEVSDFTDANTWRFGKQIAEGSSAYSSMCMQDDGRIGFIYEGTPQSHNGYGYSIIYQALTIEEATGGAYSTPDDITAAKPKKGQTVVKGGSNKVDVYSIDGKLLRKNADLLTALQGLEKGTYIINNTKIKK